MIAYLPSDFCFLRILHRANDAIIPPAAILVAKYDVVVKGGIALQREEISMMIYTYCKCCKIILMRYLGSL